jgi:phasin family protein
MLTAEQVLAAHKANVETLFGLTNKAFEGVEKLVELNLQVAKTALSEAADTTAAALSVKDAQELLSLQAGLLQPTAEKAAAYSRHLYDIASATGAEVAKAPKPSSPTRRRSSPPSSTTPPRTPRPAPRTPSPW